MVVNVAKTVYLKSLRYCNVMGEEIVFRGDSVAKVSKFKYLGVWVDRYADHTTHLRT